MRRSLRPGSEESIHQARPGGPYAFRQRRTASRPGDAAALELNTGDTIYVRVLRIPAVELVAGAV